jgi:hypothetical protein
MGHANDPAKVGEGTPHQGHPKRPVGVVEYIDAGNRVRHSWRASVLLLGERGHFVTFHSSKHAQPECIGRRMRPKSQNETRVLILEPGLHSEGCVG